MPVTPFAFLGKLGFALLVADAILAVLLVLAHFFVSLLLPGRWRPRGPRKAHQADKGQGETTMTDRHGSVSFARMVVGLDPGTASLVAEGHGESGAAAWRIMARARGHAGNGKRWRHGWYSGSTSIRSVPSTRTTAL